MPAGFPRILQNPSMKVVEKGRNAVLVCEVSGGPNVHIYWVKDTMRLKPNPRYSVLKTGKLRGEKSLLAIRGKMGYKNNWSKTYSELWVTGLTGSTRFIGCP